MQRLIWPVLMVGFIFGLAGCPRPQPAQPPPPASDKPGPRALMGEVRAYIPCGMIIPMRAVTDEFQKQNPSVKVVGVYDNAGIIVKRLTEKHEAADLMVSPGKTEIAKLAAAGLVDAAGEKVLGTFELVCIVPAASTLKIAQPADLKQCQTVAMPSPDVNSVGTSGQEALTKLGLWETLKPKMILPAHAIEAHTMVAAGKAQAGISYRNCPLETNPAKLNKSKVRIAFSFPADSYARQPLLAAVTTNTQNRAAAEALLAFMDSPAGRKVLGDNGMTGCLDMAACAAASGTAKSATPAAAPGPAKQAPIHVMAFYPGTGDHLKIKNLVLSLPKTYGDKVSAEFIDFTTDAGYKIWHEEKGMSCGGILINDEQTWTYEDKGKLKEVTFKMAMGGEWTPEDLHAVIKKLLAEQK